MKNIAIKKIVLIIVAVFVIFISIAIGSVNMPLGDVAQILGNKFFNIPISADIPANYKSLVLDIRLPRVVMAFLVGGAMAINGAVVQSILKNPLASPYSIGISAGAGVGATIVIVGGISSGSLGIFLLPSFGLAFAVITVLSVMWLASRVDKNLSNITVILIGMVVSLFLSAIINFLSTLSPTYAQRIALWQLGSFSSQPWDYVYVFAGVLLICAIIFYSFSNELDVMTFGEEQATALGVNLKRTKWILFFTMAILTGTAVSFVGIIGFIDLISPHIVRKLFGSRHRSTFALNFIFGGTFMLLCDLLARTLMSPREIPIGTVTAIIGTPFFIFLFLRRKVGS